MRAGAELHLVSVGEMLGVLGIFTLTEHHQFELLGVGEVRGPKECVIPEGPTGQEGQEGPQGLEHGGGEGASQRAQTMVRFRGAIKAQQGDPGPEEGRRGQCGWGLVPGMKGWA